MTGKGGLESLALKQASLATLTSTLHPAHHWGTSAGVGEGVVLGPLRTTLLHPLEGWPRPVDRRQRLSWCCAQAAAGERMGVGKRRRMRRRKGGVGGWVSRISKT